MDQKESGPGALVSTEKVPPVSKRKSTDWPPQLLIPRVPQVLLGLKLVWRLLGTFSLDCLESLTPEAYILEDSLFSSMVLSRPDIEAGGGLDT